MSQILILVSWFYLFFLFVGNGMLVLSILFDRKHYKPTYIETFWVGWVSIIVILQIWHFWFPVNDALRIILITSGIVGLYFRKDFCFQLTNIFILLLYFIFLFWLSNLSLGPVGPYDMGLYHAQAIGWNKFSAIVPGLGNLHHRLGVNCSYFLYHALLDGNSLIRSYNTAASLLLAVLVMEIATVVSIVIQRRNFSYSSLIPVLFFPAILFQCIENACGTSTDLPIFIIIIIIVMRLLKSFFYQYNQSLERSFNLLYIFMFAAIGITIKLTIVPFIMGLFFILPLLNRPHPMDPKGLKQIIISILMLGLILIPWLIGNTYLSGYLFYPYFAMNVSWRLPVEFVQSNIEWVKSWARIPHVHPSSQIFTGFHWVQPWFSRILSTSDTLLNFVFPIICGFYGFLVMLYRYYYKKSLQIINLGFFIISGFSSFLISLLIAPEPRFMSGIVWYFGICGFILISYEQNDQIARNVSICFIILLSVAVLINGKDIWKIKKDFSRIPNPIVYPFKTNYGLMIYATDKNEAQCWEKSLICTPYPNKWLLLRNPSRLQNGFRIEQAKE